MKKILTFAVILTGISGLGATELKSPSSINASQSYISDSVNSVNSQNFNIATSSNNPISLDDRNPIITLDKFEGKLHLTSDENNWDDRLPWIFASIISIATLFVTWLLGKQQLKALKEQSANDFQIAKLNLNAQVLSNNRQAWINELREISSKFLTNLISFKGEFADQMNQNGSFAEDVKVKEYKYEMNFTATKMELMLNPQEDDTKSLLEQMDVIKTELLSDEVDKLNEAIENFKKQIKLILKKEWIRVKEMK